MAIPMIPSRTPAGIQAGSPDLIGLQRRVQALDSNPDPQKDQLARYLLQLTQQNKVGTPEYFIAAGEYQNRQKMRQEQQAKQPDQPKVIQKLIADAAKDTAMNQGIPALPAQNVGGYAPGGIVAFEDGGAVPRYQGQFGSVVRTPTQPTFVTAMRDPSRMDPATLRAYLLSRGEPLPVELMTEEERRRGPYPAGVFPKIGRVFSDIGESVGDVVFPGGANFYSASARAATPATLAARGEPGTTGDPTIMTPGDLKRFEKAQGSAYMNQPAETPPYIPRSMQMGDVSKAPAAAPFGAFMARAEKELGAKGEGPMTAAERVQQMKDYMKAAGYDESFFEKQRADIEKEKGKTDEDKRQATNMRLIEMGLGILGGESPYAFVNIGKGAAPALKGLQEDLKDIRKLNREYDKAIRDLNVAEQSGKREMGLKALQRAQEKEDQLEQKKFDLAKTMMTIQANKDIAAMPGVQERIISQLPGATFGEKFATYMGATRAPGASSDSSIVAHYLKNPNELMYLEMSNKPEERAFAQQIRNKMMLMGTVTSPTAPQNARP